MSNNNSVETASNIQNLELATCFAVSSQVIEGNLNGVSNEEGLMSPKEAGNCMSWVAGHILMARGGLLKLLGEQPVLSEEEGQPYKQSSPALQRGDTHIPLAQLRQKLKESGELICANLREMPPEKLREELDKARFPVQIEGATYTLGTMISELLYHDGYHTGQLALLRRVLGKKGLF